MSILIKGYVEREQALDVIDLADFIADERGLLLDADSVQACLLDIPTADVQPVARGEWELVDGAEPRRYGCSVCKRLSWDETNFCPNCGADMRGVDDG